MSTKRNLYQLLFESAAEAILILQNGRCIECNASAVALFGCSKEALIGQTILHFSPPFQPDGDDSAHLLHAKIKAVLTGQEQQFDWLYRRLDGKPFYSRVTLKKLGGDEDTCLQLSLRDITQQVQQEELLHRNESLLLERRKRQVKLSNQVGQAISLAKDLDDLYRRVVVEVKEQFHYYHAQLFSYDPFLKTVVLVAGYGEVGENVPFSEYQTGARSGLVDLAASTGETVLRSIVVDDPLWRPNPYFPHVEGQLAVPIVMRDRVLGVLDVYSDIAGLLDENDQLLLEGLCGQIATSIAGTHIRQDMENRLRELSALQRLTTLDGWHTFMEENVESTQPDGYLFYRDIIQPFTPAQMEIEISHQSENGPALISFPMTVYGHKIGELGVFSDPDNPLTHDEQSLLESLTVQVAEALERARLLEQTKQQAAQAALREQYQKSVAQIATILTERGSESLSDVLALLGQATEASRVYYCETFEDEDGECWQQVAEWSAPGIKSVKDNPKYNSLAVSRVSHLALQLQSEGQFVGSVVDLPSPERELFVEQGIRSLVCLAVPGKFATPGFVGFNENTRHRVWRSEELTALQTAIAALTNTIILEDVMRQMQNSLAESEAQAHRLAELSEMSRKLNLARDENEFFDIITGSVPNIFEVDQTSITMLTEKKDELEILSVTGSQETARQGAIVPLKNSLIASAIKQNRVIVEHNPPDVDDTDPHAIRSMMIAPFAASGAPLGTINVGSKRRNAFTSRDEYMLLQIVSLFSAAIENRRLFEQTQVALAEAKETQRRYTVQSWESYQKSHEVLNYQYVRSGVEPLAVDKFPTYVNRDGGQKQAIAVQNRGSAYSEQSEAASESSLITPLALRDEVIGLLGVQETESDRVWLPEEIALVEAIAAEFTQVAEELRLLDDTQARAAQEVRINEISERIQAAQSVDEALKIAIKEVGQTLQASQTIARLDISD